MLCHLHGFSSAHGQDDVSRLCRGAEMLCRFEKVIKVLRLHRLSHPYGINQFLCAYKARIMFSGGVDVQENQAVDPVETFHKVMKERTSSCIGMRLEDHMHFSVFHLQHGINGAFDFSGMMRVIINDHDA